MRDFGFYLKTTDTCQLDCKHCFTYGKNGAKGWFDVDKTVDFFRRFKDHFADEELRIHVSLFGGEPLLCPADMIVDFHGRIRELFPQSTWTTQSNLTFKLTEDKHRAIRTIGNIGTSWDKDIRWATRKQYSMWKENIAELTEMGYNIQASVCLGRPLVEKMSAIDIIEEVAKPGIKRVLFERMTADGYASRDSSVFPDNIALNEWFVQMWRDTLEHKLYERVANRLLNEILDTFVKGQYSGIRCRDCEQKLFTVNANGTIGGCINTATDNPYGSIEDDIPALLNSTGRLCSIQTELVRHPLCFSCPVFQICNGDCHQQIHSWQGNVCSAPKALMNELQQLNDIELYKEILSHSHHETALVH